MEFEKCGIVVNNNNELENFYIQSVLEKLYLQKKKDYQYNDKIEKFIKELSKFDPQKPFFHNLWDILLSDNDFLLYLKKRVYLDKVYPNRLSIKSNTFNMFIVFAFLTIIVVMIAHMVFCEVDSLDSLKTKKKFSSEKLNEKEKTSKTNKQREQRKRDSDRPFFSFVRRQKKLQVSESLSANFVNYLKESVNNWWENKPFQRERVALFPIPLLQSVSMPRGGYQLLTYEELKVTLDPVFLIIHLYKMENLLVLHLDKISQLSKELNISEKNSGKQTKKLKKLKELFKSGKQKNPLLLFDRLDRLFKRLSGVVGFGIALRILSLAPLDPLNSLDYFESHDSLVQNYQDFVPQIPVSKELTNEVKIQVGNKILVFPKKVTKELKELKELTGSLEVRTGITNKNINEITPSVISKRPKVKIKPVKRAKLMRFSDLPKLKYGNPTEEIFTIYNNRPSIQIQIKVQ